MIEDEERIRRRAHEIWEREGRPEGREQDHWFQARRETKDEGRPDGGDKDSLTGRSLAAQRMPSPDDDRERSDAG